LILYYTTLLYVNIYGSTSKNSPVFGPTCTCHTTLRYKLVKRAKFVFSRFEKNAFKALEIKTSIYSIAFRPLIIRSPEIVVGELTVIRLLSSSSFFTSYRPSSLNGTQPKLTTRSKVKAI